MTSKYNMIQKIIIFGDFKAGRSVPLKSAAVMRLSYLLRQKGYTVKQVHHCTTFSPNELKQIISNFSQGDKVCVCVSTSFMSAVDRKNKILLQKDVMGSAWGSKTFDFLLAIGALCEEFGLPYLLGGWEIVPEKFMRENTIWDFDKLAPNVTYFVRGRDIDIIEDVCHDRDVKFELFGKNRRLATTNDVLDFTDCSSSPLPEDHIVEGESLVTEVAAGCIFSCSFCNYAVLGKKKNEYTRTYESFEREIVENYQKFKTELYTLTDNIVNDTPEKIRYLIDVREKTGIDFKWVGYARLDTIQTKEQAILLKESGMVGAAFGIESLHTPTGRYIGKLTDKARLVKSLDLLRSVVQDDAILSGLFIAGLPEETTEHVMQTVEWLDSLDGRYLLDAYSYAPLIIHPDNENKNDINKARNNPFKDYVVIDRFKDWTSPWSTSKEMKKLTRMIAIKKMNRKGGAFTLPYMVNAGYELKNLIRDIRESGKKNVPFVYEGNVSADAFIQEYKSKLLSFRNSSAGRTTDSDSVCRWFESIFRIQ